MQQLQNQSSEVLNFPITPKLIAYKTLRLLLEHSNFTNDDVVPLDSLPIYFKVLGMVENNQTIKFILPAFPAKSSNNQKTSGPAPDMGEVLGLQMLNELCNEISEFYTPGAQTLICSDGRVFNDLVQVTDEDLLRYRHGIDAIIKEFQFSNLETFNLDACYPMIPVSEIRETLIKSFGKPTDEVRLNILANSQDLQTFNGIHRFIKDDFSQIFPELSRRQIDKHSKKVAYQVIQRSNAWSQLLEARFPDAARLSIHPYRSNALKFGIKLVSSSDKWGTPWHNVTVKKDGRFQLVRKSELAGLNPTELLYRGKYVYFEV